MKLTYEGTLRRVRGFYFDVCWGDGRTVLGSGLRSYLRRTWIFSWDYFMLSYLGGRLYFARIFACFIFFVFFFLISG